MIESAPTGLPTHGAPPPAPPRASVLFVLFLAALAVFAVLFLRMALLYDQDSYLHLAIARLYADGIPRELPWARLSLQHEGFGDKDFLFHLLLLPFSVGDAPIGGRLALALLDAAILTLLSGLGWRALGPWGAVLGPMVFLLPAGFLPRAVRLRPELLALLLLLAAVEAAGRRRYLLLGLVAAAFSLTYVAAHVLPILGILWLLGERLRTGRWELRLALVPSAGAAAGLLLHPHFPKYLEIVWVVNVKLHQWKSQMDMGDEIWSPALSMVALDNAPFLLALAGLVLSSIPAASGTRVPAGVASATAVAALAFVALYSRMARMITYAAPLLALVVAHEIARRGRRPGAWLFVGRWRIPVVLLYGAALATAYPALHHPTFVALLNEAEHISAEGERAAFGRSIPDGARVAATWQDAEGYAFWAPQGRYLNVFDPIFMLLSHPRSYRTSRALFAGAEPDVPLAVAGDLQSDYLAFARSAAPPALLQRIAGDPRLRILYPGYDVLVEVVPGANDSFVLDWRDQDGCAWPRSADPALAAVEGFVDLSRLGEPSGCKRLTSSLDLAEPASLAFAPWGSGRLQVDGQEAVAVAAPAGAIPTAAPAVALSAGPHELAVETCAHAGRSGFYLRRLPAAASPGQ